MEALCKLARSSPSFADKCLDFLVDMFNDEIEEVRLQSIHVLRQISTHITLREDQLDTVLAVLEVRCLLQDRRRIYLDSWSQKSAFYCTCVYICSILCSGPKQFDPEV